MCRDSDLPQRTKKKLNVLAHSTSQFRNNSKQKSKIDLRFSSIVFLRPCGRDFMTHEVSVKGALVLVQENFQGIPAIDWEAAH